jgi:GT2 family glycosyltransferase
MISDLAEPIDTPVASPSLQTSIGVVAIGRNEGLRLKRCLESVQGSDTVVYVDSGSTDYSLVLSRGLNADVVELDTSIPFTAARARNEGFRRLLQLRPDVDYVFFVDGDCEVASGWLETARKFLDEHPEFAVVWGFRRERFPDKSIYNMLCDVEWLDYPTGETKYCGGDALMRVKALRQVDGYRSDLICMEEPEVCVRLRQAGWRIYRLLDLMTLHDAAIYRFGQWWKRMQRGGYGFAQGAAIHGGPPERFGVHELQRALFWGFAVPTGTVIGLIVIGPAALLLLGIYPLQIVRIALKGKHSARENWWRAGALVLAKFAETQGVLRYLMDRLRRERTRLIEYK